jgi:hypothetical protein
VIFPDAGAADKGGGADPVCCRPITGFETAPDGQIAAFARSISKCEWCHRYFQF